MEQDFSTVDRPQEIQESPVNAIITSHRRITNRELSRVMRIPVMTSSKDLDIAN